MASPVFAPKSEGSDRLCVDNRNSPTFLPPKRMKMDPEETGKWDASALKELDDSAIQEKIDHEVRMREGTVKLLAACHGEAQALEASKNMLTINSRILALMSLLQRHRAKSVNNRIRRKNSSSVSYQEPDDDQMPCKAKVSLSDIRVPLMWSQDDHFKAKTEQHVYYVFCLLKMEGQVLDTSMVETDESETDVTFNDVIVFENVSHDFKLEIEIYYTVSAESPASRTAGVKRPLRRMGSISDAPKFVLAGHTQLTVEHVHEDIKTHDLKTGLVGASPSTTAATTEGSDAPELALWGQVCVRLAARPDCLHRKRMSGFLHVQRVARTGGQSLWDNLWCVMHHASLRGWNSKEEVGHEAPVETIEIKPGMKVADTVSPTFKQRHILILTSLVTHDKEPVLACNEDDEYVAWREALQQATLDVSAWKSACKQEMTIQEPQKKLPVADQRKLYDSIEVTIACEDKRSHCGPLSELTCIPCSSPSIQCTYDIWQRRDSPSNIHRKSKKDDNMVNYETTI